MRSILKTFSRLWRILVRLDEFLVNCVELLCHKIQIYTRKSNFWLYGKFSLLVSYSMFIGFLTYLFKAKAPWLKYLGAGFSGNTADWLCMAIIVPSGVVEAAWFWKRMESAAYARILKGVMNPRKIEAFSILLRLTWVFLLIVDLFTLRFYLFTIAASTCSFLHACDPLPPCTGKIWELLKGIGKLVPVVQRG